MGIDNADKNNPPALDITNPFSLEYVPAASLDTINPRILTEMNYILRDLLAGDNDTLNRPEFRGLNVAQIKAALDFILTDQNLSPLQKSDLLANSWRVNYRDKPPSPEEFLTEKYLGPVAGTIFPHIKNTFIEYLDPTKPYRTCVLYPHIGWGKMLHRKELVYTPDGYKTVEDIRVDDEVCTPNGGVARITSKQDYPDEKLYRLTFADGRTVIAGGPHYWKAAKSRNGIVWSKEQKKYIKQKSEPCWKIITTEEIIKSIEANPKDRWFIPFTSPVQHTAKPHFIPPYTLGAFLGDGSLTDSGISIGNDDVEIIERVGRDFKNMKLPFTWFKSDSCDHVIRVSTRGGQIRKHLEDLKLLNTYCHSKFIPNEYLYDSIENRIALLQGLMDTDGSAHRKAGMAVYYTVSERLRDNVIELVRGLGGRASYTTRLKERLSNANHNQFVVSISFPQNLFPIFYLKRKQEWIDNGFERDRNRSKTQYLYIDKIEEIDETGGACISIDDEEKLFLTTGYTVTHNSYLAVLVNLFVGVHMAMMRAPWKFFGQSQPLDCTVLTPSGFKPMGDIDVGDQVVTPTGEITEVIEIHPQGIIPTYEIELDDGRVTRCSAQHLWKVSYRSEDGEKIWEIVTTQFMIDHPDFEFEIPESPLNTPR